MSGQPIPTERRRSKRRASIEAAKKIKKMVHEDITPAEEFEYEYESKRSKKDNKRKAPKQKSAFFHQQGHRTPSSSLAMSLSSLPAIREDVFSSRTIEVGSFMSPSPYSIEEFYELLDEELNRDNEDMEREYRRRQRLVNSTGTMYLSSNTEYRMSLYSSKRSPIYAKTLQLTPFVDVPTTPMHVYQYRPGTASRTESAQRPPPSSSSSRFRPSGIRRKFRAIKPRQLM